MFGARIFMVGSFGVRRSTCQVWRSSMLHVWCMELCGRQFWSMEVNPVVFWCIQLCGRQFRSMEVNPAV